MGSGWIEMSKPDNRGKDSQELAVVLRKYFAGQPDVVAAYLFGSQVGGRARAEGDVDVAVLLSIEDDFARFERQLRLGSEAEEVVGRPVDLIMLNDAPPVLVHQVLKNGHPRNRWIT